MNRLLALALVASIGNASAVFAGESLLTSGTRHAQQLAVSAVSDPSSTSTSTAAASTAAVAGQSAQKAAPSYQAEGGNLSKSGMGKGKKTLLYIGLAVAFAASVWTIDHHVLDVTPSSLGTRQD
jgi:hypothetical protein